MNNGNRQVSAIAKVEVRGRTETDRTFDPPEPRISGSALAPCMRMTKRFVFLPCELCRDSLDQWTEDAWTVQRPPRRVALSTGSGAAREGNGRGSRTGGSGRDASSVSAVPPLRALAQGNGGATDAFSLLQAAKNVRSLAWPLAALCPGAGEKQCSAGGQRRKRRRVRALCVWLRVDMGRWDHCAFGCLPVRNGALQRGDFVTSAPPMHGC
jgi:hypothetical protein